MPIKDIESSQRMPVLGKIRLGIRKESAKGNLYPSEVEYFVLTDAPEVGKIYGAEPKELDIIFTDDDLDKVIPTWYRFYAGGFMGKDGKITGGKIQCQGDGENAQHFAKKDPVTRIVPARACLKEKCPDWLGKNGVQQCKQGMNVLAMLPRVSPYGVYQIDTTSWKSIRSFWDQLMWVKKLNNGSIRGVPFRIARVATDVSYFDKDGVQKTKQHAIMTLQHNPGFLEKYGNDMQQLIQKCFGSIQQLPAAADIVEQPMLDHIPIQQQLEDAGEAGVAVIEEDPALALADHPEVVALFNEIGKLKNVEITPKKRLMNIKTALHKQSNLDVGGLKDLLAKQVQSLQPQPQAAADGII